MTKKPESINTINTDCKLPTLPKEPKEFHKPITLKSWLLVIQRKPSRSRYIFLCSRGHVTNMTQKVVFHLSLFYEKYMEESDTTKGSWNVMFLTECYSCY